MYAHCDLSKDADRDFWCFAHTEDSIIGSDVNWQRVVADFGRWHKATLASFKITEVELS